VPQSAINVLDKFSKFQTQWTPRVIAEMNDYQFKIARIQGEFIWHHHADTDEVFFIIEGEMVLRLRDGDVPLRAGEMYVVPKGVDHLPCAANECKIMLIEPRGVTNTGNVGGERTAQNDVWV
jgi:mannose-6-phosphate isomerase-like protein (cupin superfamily)